jgi:PTH1 family peptidyl-tRNA hydrolase
MWLVAGLGNPGEEYADTRHNAGYMVIDNLAAGLSVRLKQKTSSYIYARGFIGEREALFIKPLTFMNRSGIAVRDALRKFDNIDNILVVHDDLDLDTGVVRIRKSGSSGGHNGVQSVIDFLGTKDFIRLKIGIGRPVRGPAEKYVLKRCNKQERPLMEEAVEKAADAVSVILNKGVSSAQNIFHRETV